MAAPGEACFERLAEDVFDHAVVTELLTEFMADARHHIAIALDEGTVVGMASAVHYVHPDKLPELWINEIGVASSHRRLGLASRLLDVLFEHGSRLGCSEAWVLTERGNEAARALYRAKTPAAEQDDVVMYSWTLRGD